MTAKRTRAFVDRWTAWSPVLLLAGIAALTLWLDAQVRPPEPSPSGNLRHDPDVIITNFRAINFDAQGRVKQALTAQRAQHYPDDLTVDFVAPSLVLTDPARPRFSVTSDTGTLSGDRETVLFRGNVQATREPAAGANGLGAVKLMTDFLRVVPGKGIADTDRPVTIEEPRGIIRGVGVTLDNNARTMRIKSGVRGSLQPESPK
jgi:lipopolysaccharide export system protein LptC